MDSRYLIWCKWCLPLLLLGFSCRPDPQVGIRTFIDAHHPLLQPVLSNPEIFEYQIHYVRIDRDANNRPSFETFAENSDPARYFYPASTIKMANAILALEKIRALDVPELTPFSAMRIDSARYPQSPFVSDSTAKDRVPHIAHFVKKAFLVSDNEASNRLYEFLGQDDLHRSLRGKGLNRTRIIHRLSDFRFGPEDNKYTNPVWFLNQNKVVFHQPERRASFEYVGSLHGEVRGKGFIDTSGQLIERPFDFSQKNFFPLDEQVRMMQAILFPESVPDSLRFDLNPGDYELLYKVMGMRPRESQFPEYDSTYSDSYAKFYIYGDSKKPIPDHIRIFNKVGWAYGYLTDCAYLADFRNNVEFILAATVHVNANGIYNDGVYEYEEMGIPFLAELGRQFYQYELSRKRVHAPDLSKFEVQFHD